MRYLRAFVAACVVFAACSHPEEPVGPQVVTDDGLIVSNAGESSFQIVYSSAKPNAEGFAAFLARYRKALPMERTATEVL